LSEFLVAERASHTVYPPEDQVWTWTHTCPISQVKVVILGQDPYHSPRQAHGTVVQHIMHYKLQSTDVISSMSECIY